MNLNLKKQKAIVMRLITRIISSISNIFTRAKNISIPIKIILIVAVTLVFFMVIENAIIYRVTYNKMVSTNKQNMKLVSNEVYENFINLIKLQTSDVEKNALNADVIGVVKHKNVTQRDEFKIKYKNEIEKMTNKLITYAKSNKSDEHEFIADKDGIIIVDSDEEYLNSDLSQNDYTKSALGGCLQ
ncbi:hypothetical protein [Clostridium estertheticum]|uniref:Uncharacterized protein n=1 Tax=Clostridium estertheticum subsp. estertheticum TaxID=1552 RepID=A0A1J0GF20_9CLOT|nr:hypothetical protein [Clostridium estertheticum]APC39560.1 hypothetical protein A7L45_05505 [Clostridium estertheticum subsp. estertheticum]